MDNTNYNTSQFQSEMSNLPPEHDDSDKSIRKNLVQDVARLFVNSKMINGGRVHHGEFNKQLEHVKDICPTITRNMINKDMRVHWTSLKMLMDEDEYVVVSNEDNNTNVNFSRDRVGRPVGTTIFGTTIVWKHENKLRRFKVHNNITMKYAIEKGALYNGKRLPRGLLLSIV